MANDRTVKLRHIGKQLECLVNAEITVFWVPVGRVHQSCLGPTPRIIETAFGRPREWAIVHRQSGVEGSKSFADGDNCQRGVRFPSVRDGRLPGDGLGDEPTSLGSHAYIDRTRHRRVRGSPPHADSLGFQIEAAPDRRPLHEHTVWARTELERQAAQSVLPNHTNISSGGEAKYDTRNGDIVHRSTGQHGEILPRPYDGRHAAAFNSPDHQPNRRGRGRPLHSSSVLLATQMTDSPA